jgi:hypothetical protein
MGESAVATNYKYNPADFERVLGLSTELAEFYRLHNEYLKEKTQSKRFELEKHGMDLFFTIKARGVEGSLTRNTVYDLHEHMEDLLYDG